MNRPSSTLVSLLEQRAALKPDERAFTFLLDGETSEQHLSYRELDLKARAIAAALVDRGASGSRALILYPPGLDYIAAFFGCLYANVVAVPAYPPDPARLERTIPRLLAIVEDAQATVALTTTPILQMADFVFAQAPALAQLTWLATDELAATDFAPAMDAISSASLAFLQYTSGSTGTPKGVMLTHGNLLHNEALIQTAFAHDERSLVVGWLPLYHDMGLIGNLLQPLYLGIPCVLMSPIAFLQRPLRWLQAISRYRATTSGGPNFAYDLCVKKTTVEERAALDLSSWKLAFNGAEPVRPETMERFSAAFGPSGFRREAFYPCYGLAEGTLIVSGGQAGVGPLLRSIDRTALREGRAAAGADSVTLVGAGRPLGDQQVVIVEPESRRRCGPGEVGEIWVQGGSVAQGYWQRVEATEELFRARLQSGEGPFLRTGDLGFLDGGELFVTGRRKDLIILRGRNVYPQDLEQTLEALNPALRPGCGAAFSVDAQGDERVVVVFELDRRAGAEMKLDALIAQMAQALAEQYEVQLSAVVLIKAGSIPKTSSGKIQRRATREDFLAGRLDVIASWQREDGEAAVESTDEAPVGLPTGLVGELIQILAEVMELPARSLDPARPISQYGMDSLVATQLVSQVRHQLGVELSLRAVFDAPTVNELAEQVTALRKDAQPVGPALVRVLREGALPLSYAQERYWILGKQHGGARFHLGGELRIVGALDRKRLEQALSAVVERHEVLQMCFPERDGRPTGRLAERRPSMASIEWIDVAADRAAALVEQARTEPFDVEQGPLMRVLGLSSSANEHRVVVVIHHLVFDGWSVALFVDELARAYRALGGGAQLDAPAAIQYADFAAWQRERLSGAFIDQHLGYWKEQLAGAPAEIDLPRDAEAATSVGGATRWVELRGWRPRLAEVSRQIGATDFVLLLAAFKGLLLRVTGQADLVVGTVVAERSRAELEGLIGCFVNFVALRTTVSPQVSWAGLIEAAQQTVQAAREHQEAPFEQVVRAVGGGRRRMPLYNVGFLLQNLPQRTLELGDGLKLELKELERREALLDLRVEVLQRGDDLVVGWEYRPELFREETIAALVDGFAAALERVVGPREEAVARLPVPARLAHDTVAIAATFTAEPIREALHFWARLEQQRLRLEFAPYGQVFQSLLEEGSVLRGDGPGHNVLLLRFGDLGPPVESELRKTVEDLAQAIAVASQHGRRSWLVVHCPESPTQSIPEATWQGLEAELAAGLKPHGVTFVGATELAQLYPVADWHDAKAEELGKIPYTETQWAALGTLIARKRAAVKRMPYKVIALDLDETLWRGVCGEDGALGVRPRPWLQDFLLDQKRKGMLLCLCSKNEESDAFEVFDRNPEMRLGRKDIVAAKINWRSKADNLAELSQELSLGLDSFIFIDDNPRECAEVAARHPEVLVVELPQVRDEAALEHYFHHVWGFDRARVTKEDERRTELYLENAERTRAAAAAPTLASFLAKLELVVEIRALGADDLERAAQLTQRTNQFNLSGRRKQVGDLREYLSRPEHGGWVVEVRDRFGDYGQVGVVLHERHGDALVAETFLLSCRVLGKGVEHRVLNRLGEEARRSGSTQVELRFTATHRNQPAKSFLEQVAASYKSAAGYCLPTESAEAARYHAETASELVVEQEETRGKSAPRGPGLSPRQTGLELATATQVLEALRARRVGRTAGRGDYVAPRTPEEEKLAALWAELLSLPRVGVLDDFFDVGGDSILGVQLISRIRTTLGVELPMDALFGPASTVARQALRIAELERSGLRARPAIAPAPRHEVLALSYAQERIWFLAQLDPSSAAYNESAWVRLTGQLDVSALQAALDEIVRRHEVLRTRFPIVEGVARQVIEPELRVPLAQRTANDAAQIEREARAEAQRPFDLASGPLLRVSLWRLAKAKAEPEQLVLFTLHHIVSDGWSMGVLVKELGALYRARVTGEPASLPALPIQYADYASWQRQWIDGADLASLLGYWREKLDGAAVLQLPLEGEPGLPEGAGGELTLTLAPALADGLRRLGREENATPFMTMLAAFQLLLARLCGTRDVTVGSPIANRDRTEVEPLIGLFLNTLVLRTDLTGAPSFRALLGRVRATTLGAYAHQELPFEKLVTELRPQRGPGGNPFFDVLVNALPAQAEPLSLPGLRVETRRDAVEAKFPITLYTVEGADRWALRFVYQRALFSEARMAELGAQLEGLIEQIVADADRSIESYSLVTGRAHSLIALGEGEGPRAEPQALVVGEVRARAAEHPRSIAVRCGELRLGYAELVESGDTIARALLGQGLGRSQVVGVIGERGCGAITSMFGVWAAGCVLQPMERSQPRARQEAMAKASGMAGLVVVGDLPADELTWLETLAPFLLRVRSDGRLADGSATVASAPLPVLAGEDPAYVFFTSGTTGTPKGVLGEHRGVAHFVGWQRREFQIGPEDRAAQLTGMGFNVLLRDVWTPLVSGAELVVPPPSLEVGTRDLVEWLAAEKISLVHTVPSVMEAWVRQRPEGLDLPALRWVFSAGEALQAGLVERWRAAYPRAGQLVVVYGQTETTLAKTFFHIPTPAVPGPQPVGRPLPGAEVLVLRDDGELCGIGEPGELVIRTPYRTRGYLNASEEQAKKFGPNPRTRRTDDIVYYTGDRGRLRADGNLVLQGRRDLQVKVRGVRVEIGEIETCLGRHTDIEQAVVAPATLNDELGLWGYVVPRAGATVTEDALRRWMRGQVPDAMQPSGYVFLESLPRGKNGKVDRQSLPAPGLRRERGTEVAPRTPIEEQLVAIWRDVLRIDRVGIHDNFFDLGGHSLLATQLISQVRKRFEVDLPVRAMFEAPTIEALALRLGAAQATKRPAPPAIKRLARERYRVPSESEK